MDFFFCLSGFVIAYAYDEKLAARLRFSDFALKRLIRLYPMILFGALLGGGAWLVGKSFGAFGEIVAVTVATLALIPLGLAFHEQAYPPNNPLWSLFFELTANAVYGIERRIFPARKALLALLILSASGVALVAVSYLNRGLEFVGFASYSSTASCGWHFRFSRVPSSTGMACSGFGSGSRPPPWPSRFVRCFSHPSSSRKLWAYTMLWQ